MPRFKACHPDSQKCVSSLNDTGYPAMDPVPFSCNPEEAAAAVRRVIESHERTAVEEDDGPYVRVLYRTKILRFKDEVEVEVDPDAGVVHFRSRSTLSWARDDIGANRTRMERFSADLRDALPAG